MKEEFPHGGREEAEKEAHRRDQGKMRSQGIVPSHLSLSCRLHLLFLPIFQECHHIKNLSRDSSSH